MLELEWAGWYKSTTSDKLWGILKSSNGTYYNFWCRRGSKMNFKQTLRPKYSHKSQKGYKSIDLEMLETIYPGFMQEAINTLVIKILSGDVH